MNYSYLQYFGYFAFAIGTVSIWYSNHKISQKKDYTISALEQADTPEAIASRTLKWTLESALSQLKTGELSSETQGALFSSANGGRFDDEDKATLYKIYSLIDINDSNSGNQMLRVAAGYKLLQYPDFVLSNLDVFFQLLDGRLDNIFSMSTDEETKQNYIRLGIDKINQEGGFTRQISFTDLDGFFRIAFSNEADSAFIYNLVTSEEDKRYIYETYYLPQKDHILTKEGILTSEDYWKKLLDAEFPG